MDDRLQRRLRDADPLTAADGQTPPPVRLDAIKEQIMHNDERPVRAAFRPRTLGLVGVTAASLALVLAVGTLVRPTGTALAWVSRAHGRHRRAEGRGREGVHRYGRCGQRHDQGAGGLVEGQDGEAPAIPAPITTIPPLVSLELHGNGGVAILSDGTTTGYCLLRWDGTTFTAGGLAFGMGAPAGFEDGFLVSGMATEFEGQELGIVAGGAPQAPPSSRSWAGPPTAAPRPSRTASSRCGSRACPARTTWSPWPTTPRARSSPGRRCRGPASSPSW